MSKISFTEDGEVVLQANFLQDLIEEAYQEGYNADHASLPLTFLSITYVFKKMEALIKLWKKGNKE
jgi:hypothetical protein